MPHKIQWLVPDRVIIAQISGDIAVEDIAEINREMSRCWTQDARLSTLSLT
jgi:hypothetical protein